MYYDQLSNLGIKLRRRSGQEKTTCPQCSESRRNKKDTSLSVNITEGTYNCHHCSWKGSVKQFQQKEMKKKFEKPDQSMLKSISLNEKVVAYSKARGISEDTLKRFMIHAKEEWMPQTQKKERCIVFPYIRSGELINAKFRDGAKNFRLCKDAEMTFFGMQTLDGKHCAIITEGEWDALAAYEAGFGKNYETVADKDGVVVEHDLGRWAVLSVPNGASMGSQKLEYLDNCSDWLSSIDEFVIATDGDEAGISLRDELVRRLGVEKCRILHYPSDAVISNTDGSKRACKDLNEVLLVFGKDALISLVNESDALPVDGITYLGDIFPTMLENFRNGVKLSPTTRFGDFDEYFRWKKGDINVVIGYGNHT
jgi:twinkle protein